MIWLLAALISLGSEPLDVEIADTFRTRSRGLMERYTLDDGKGMLFVYDKPQILSFWMKNTKIPLSVGFFDEEKRLVEMRDMNVVKKGPLPVYQSKSPCLYAIEVPQGWFQKKNIRLGEKFSFHDSKNSL